MTAPAPVGGRVPLLNEDELLALGVPEDEREVAARAVVVPLVVHDPGPVELIHAAEEPLLGVVVLDGFLAAATHLGARVSEQLLGPSDVIDARPEAADLLPVSHSYEALTVVRTGVLDRRFIAAVRRWPGVMLALNARLSRRQRILAVHAAIGHLPRGEDRVLAVLWQIGAQWGRVHADGVALPLSLTHAAIGRLAGASRPTTSLALTALGHEGILRLGDDGRLHLAHGSAAALAEIPQRLQRRTVPPLTPVELRERERKALLARVAVMHERFDEGLRHYEATLRSTQASAARNAAAREAARATYEPLD